MPISFNGSYGITAGTMLIGTSPAYPASSAREIIEVNPKAPSGWYWIRFPATSSGTLGEPFMTYCDMTGAECGSNLRGWMRLDDGWFNANALMMFDHEQGIENTWYSNQGSWAAGETSSGAFWFNPAQVDGIIRSFQFKLPKGSRGIRVTRLDFYTVNGPDGYAFTETSGTPSPTNAQIISAARNNTISLGSNYASFGIYFGDSNGTGVRLWKGNYPSTWITEYNGARIYLIQDNFVQYDDIGTANGADRIIWYESDGTTEYNQIYNWTFWVR